MEHVLALAVPVQRKSKTFQVKVDGTLRTGSAKDMYTLALISKIGVRRRHGLRVRFTGERHPATQHGKSA